MAKYFIYNNAGFSESAVTDGTVSGTTLTWSTAVAWGGGTSVAFQYQSVVYDATADKFVIAWENYASGAHSGRTIVGTVDGSNNITFGLIAKALAIATLCC